MLDSDFFDKVGPDPPPHPHPHASPNPNPNPNPNQVEEIARRMRDSEEPFGGVQLVLCGSSWKAASCRFELGATARQPRPPRMVPPGAGERPRSSAAPPMRGCNTAVSTCHA